MIIPLDFIFFVIAVGSVSIYLNRRWQDYVVKKKLLADARQSTQDALPSAESKAKKKRWWSRASRRKQPSDATLAVTDGTAEAVTPLADPKAKKKRRGWFGGSRREQPSDAALTGEDGIAEGVSPPVDSKGKTKRGWWGRRSRREQPSDATLAEEEDAKEEVPLPSNEMEAEDARKTPAVGEEEIDEDEEEEADAFGTSVAILIALVTLVSAWVGWSFGIVYGEAFGEQSAGMSAALSVESTLTNSSVALYNEYRVFTEYARYQTLADLQAGDEQGEAASVLIGRKTDDADLAAVQLPFFLTRYLTRDGNYDRPRQLGEAWAEAAQRVDLEPAPHFVVADVWQLKTELLVGLFIILAFSLLLLTLAEVLDRERQILRYSAAILGTLLLIFTVVAKFWIERG